MIEQLAKILNISADVLYFYARRVPVDVEGDLDDRAIEAAYRAFRMGIDSGVRRAASDVVNAGLMLTHYLDRSPK